MIPTTMNSEVEFQFVFLLGGNVIQRIHFYMDSGLSPPIHEFFYQSNDPN